MEASLTVCSLVFTLRAREWIEWEDGSGSALRGALLAALRQRFCLFPEDAHCVCPDTTCPVAALVTPGSDEYPRGAELPRPLVLRPPRKGAHSQTRPVAEGARWNRPVRLEPGERFAFTVILVGSAIKRFPALILASRAMEQVGLGRPLHANRGRRGRFIIEQIEATHPFTGTRATLFQEGEERVRAPELILTTADVAARASACSAKELRLRFLSPTRLTEAGKLVHTPEPGVLLRRMAERLDALTRAYQTNSSSTTEVVERTQTSHTPGPWYGIAHTASVYLASCQVEWLDTKSYSSRQQRSLPIGGFTGTATYCGQLSQAVRELLAWGELLHVGKNSMKGDGWYCLDV